MEIHHTARKHGVRDLDIRHAVRHAVFEGDLPRLETPPWKVLYLGPDRAGNLLEVVVIEEDDGRELVIHAMRMRRSNAWLLSRGPTP